MRFELPAPPGPWAPEHLDALSREVGALATEILRRRRAQEAEVHEMLVQVLMANPSFGQDGRPVTATAVRDAFSNLQK